MKSMHSFRAGLLSFFLVAGVSAIAGPSSAASWDPALVLERCENAAKQFWGSTQGRLVFKRGTGSSPGKMEAVDFLRDASGSFFRQTGTGSDRHRIWINSDAYIVKGNAAVKEGYAEAYGMSPPDASFLHPVRLVDSSALSMRQDKWFEEPVMVVEETVPTELIPKGDIPFAAKRRFVIDQRTSILRCVEDFSREGVLISYIRYLKADGDLRQMDKGKFQLPSTVQLAEEPNQVEALLKEGN